MTPGCAVLVLTPFREKDRLLLVGIRDALRLCRDDGYETLPRFEAEACLAKASPVPRIEVCRFVLRAGLSRLLLHELSDRRLFGLLRESLMRMALVVVRKGSEAGTGDNPSLVQQRRLVRDIRARTHSRLDYEGRRYLLVADEDLGRIANRDSYHVVPHVHAMQVLDGLAAHAEPTLARLLQEARARLTRDWRPPLHPAGLILLRRIIQVTGAAREELPITPSQLRQLRKSEWDVSPGAALEDLELELLSEQEDYELATGATAEASDDEEEEESLELTGEAPTEGSEAAEAPPAEA